jgi:hypothetical protein
MTATDRHFLDGGGELGALIRAHDWSASGLGAPSGWPQGLRTAVRLLLNRNIRFKTFFRAVILLPYIVPTALSAIAFWWISFPARAAPPASSATVTASS